ncbi:hypothetical protein LIQ62_07655 [Veillonella ratti]|uniref:hypothetical protein n=1 Tax=Veillonella TaxID=29465 RepID=UPI001D03CD8B|nr:hypothetical protein [Veillonella ratti]MCB5743807.1 hypothetical protein [Veillonella ratti]MCB5757837.1 hypothetical protein [Veillonella ratti]MCB5760085.1 hypothetical protein [Veillonella ratti]MCB5762436.1 hypothetical protein [Veillonella ratti]MCB5782762.1 hypothetical protein [Veillonella ratti]
MKKGKNIKLATKLALAALVGVTSLSVYTVDAAGLTGSYVGIGKEPTSTDVLDKGTEVNTATDSIIDYRQTTNAQGAVFSRTPTNTTKTGKALMVNRQVIKMIQIAQATQLSVLVLIRLVTTVRPLVLMLKPLLVLQL